MGRKPVGQGQYFYFCVALLIFVAGCGLLQESSRDRQLRDALSSGDSLLAHGDYEASLKVFQNVLAQAQGKPPGDAATYNMGLVYAHPQYAKRDIQKAIDSFNSVVTRYPDSPWAAQATIWVGVLSESEESKQQVETSKQMVEKSLQEVERNRQALEKSKLEIEKSRLELEKSKQEIEKNKQVIEKSKQVDIEIEQKRRDRGR